MTRVRSTWTNWGLLGDLLDPSSIWRRCRIMICPGPPPADRGNVSFRAADLLALATLALALMGCDRMESLDARRLLLTLQTPSESQAGQWVGHRGGMRHGVVGQQGTPIQFGNELNVHWSVDLPGTGNSSPTVYGERVFLTAELPGDPPQLAILSFGRRDGRLIWRVNVGPAKGRTHQKNGYASATVTTDGRRVYATFGACGVFCLDARDGVIIWHSPLPMLDHEWGHSSSPILVGDLLVQLSDGSQESCLRAFNRYDGRLLWRTDRQSTGAWCTPVLVQADPVAGNSWEIVVNGTGSRNGSAGFVIAYDPRTGEERWRVRGTTDIPCPTAIVGNGLIVSTSGPSGPIIAIRPGGRGDVTESHVVWRLPWGGPYVPTGLIDGSRLFLLSDGGSLRSLDLQQGTVVWEKRLHRHHSASLVASDGRLYAVSEQGDVHVVAMGDQYQLLSVNRLRQRCLATPAIANGELFVRTEEQLFCFKHRHEAIAQDPLDSESPTTVVSTTDPFTEKEPVSQQ